LTAREQQALGGAAEWLAILRCFCVKEAVYKVLDAAEQEDLRFRGLQLEQPTADSMRVERSDDQRVIAVAAVACGNEAMVAIATPRWSSSPLRGGRD
jgi:4'-phosphopantetheinyl transferase EntD